jgi:hypothetical protein
MPCRAVPCHLSHFFVFWEKNFCVMGRGGGSLLMDSLTKTHLLWDDDAVFKRFLSPMIHAVPVVPTGKIKSFGPFGPKYQVGPVVRPWGDDDWMVEITVVETGEKTEYRWTHLNDDPEAP